MKLNRLLASLSILPLLSGLATAVPVPSKSSTARDLHVFCKTFTVESGPSVEKAYCRGYVVGWRGGIEGVLIPDDKGMIGTVTFENDVTDDQMAKVFVLYMEKHPEEENKPPNVALLHSMLDSGLVSISLSADKGK
jgi:hypothetical protein